jgi:hypothetical protein
MTSTDALTNLGAEFRTVTEAQADAARDLVLSARFRAESPVAQKAMLLAALDLWTEEAVANGQHLPKALRRNSKERSDG